VALFGAATGVVLFVGVSGAVAALGDTVFPAADLAQSLRDDWSSSSHVFLRQRMRHPVVAVLGSGYLLWLAVLLLRRWSGTSIRALPMALASLALYSPATTSSANLVP
jgi:cytochrome c oxidase assembly protein subunit 15